MAYSINLTFGKTKGKMYEKHELVRTYRLGFITLDLVCGGVNNLLARSIKKEDELAAKSKTLDSERTHYESEYKVHTKKISELESTLAGKNTDINDLNRQIKEGKEEFTKQLKDHQTKLKKQMQEIQDKLKKKEDELSELQEENSDLETDYDNLTETYDTLLKTYTQQTQELGSIQKQLEVSREYAQRLEFIID